MGTYEEFLADLHRRAVVVEDANRWRVIMEGTEHRHWRNSVLSSRFDTREEAQRWADRYNTHPRRHVSVT